MTLAAGSRLGPYEITAKLGEGGMGEVYRAHDTKLKRDVAIKVLPAAFTEDKERLARFEREAQLLAQLHHPNIASIFGLEESEGTRALVMELVEGPTLADRLEPGSLPLNEALLVARQIAEALEEAHEKGIIHRDLKPQNIKASIEGKVKVLDFGLAKAMDPAAGVSSAADLARSPTLLNSPTLTAVHGTQLGVILGTAAYMAPEQAKGLAIDRRADIWAFGVVLYEMLCGRSLFAGETVTDTLAGVLKTEIDFSRLPVSTPAAIRSLLRRCLQRNPKNRLHDIADARLVIDDVLAGVDRDEAPGAGVVPGGLERSRRRTWVWLAAVAVAAAGAAALAHLMTARGEPAREPVRLSIQLTPEQELRVAGDAVMTFSPDGSALLFSGREKGKSWILRRSLGDPTARPIEGTADGDSVFVSPDGQWIGLTVGNKLTKVAAQGGRPFTLADARGAGGAAWLPGGRLVFAQTYSDGLFTVSEQGGAVERLTTPDRKDGVLGHWWAEPLPGGRFVVFTAFRTPVDTSRIGVLELGTGKVRWLVGNGYFGRYAPSGYLVFARGQRLFAVPFDAATATVTGPEVAVVDDVRVSQTGGFAMAAISSTGTLAYVSESLGNPVRELVWLDRQGRATPATRERRRFLSVSLSPDGERAAVTIQEQSLDLWVLSLTRGTLSRLTTSDGTEFDAKWSRDGSELFYVVDRPPFQLFRMAAGAPDSGRPIWDEAPELDTTSIGVSPDGKAVAFELSEVKTGRDLYVRPLDGSGPARVVRASRAEERQPSFSPDGRWMTYESDETGRPEVYAEPIAGTGDRVQVSADGGSEPLWARDGEIFYRHDDEMRVVATRIGARLEFDPPKTLFSYPIPHGNDENETRTFDVTADGQRILAIATPEVSRPRRIEIVTDWTRELERLAPRAKR